MKKSYNPFIYGFLFILPLLVMDAVFFSFSATLGEIFSRMLAGFLCGLAIVLTRKYNRYAIDVMIYNRFPLTLRFALGVLTGTLVLVPMQPFMNAYTHHSHTGYYGGLLVGFIAFFAPYALLKHFFTQKSDEPIT